MTDGVLAVHEVRHGRAGSLPLVLLHGFPLDHRMWLDVTALLAGDPTVLAPDLPGFGVSPVGEDVARVVGGEEPSIDVMADGVAATLRAAGIGGAVVAGLSMGGYVAMALAERHPDLVVGLGLLDTKSTADSDEARANRLRVADAVLAEGSTDPVLGMRTALLGETSRADRADLVEHLEDWITDQGPRGDRLGATCDGGPAGPDRGAAGLRGARDGGRRRAGRAEPARRRASHGRRAGRRPARGGAWRRAHDRRSRTPSRWQSRSAICCDGPAAEGTCGEPPAWLSGGLAARRSFCRA